MDSTTLNGEVGLPDRGTRRPRRRGKWFMPVLAVVVGSTLLLLAIPRMNAAFIQVPADPVNRVIARGKMPGPDALEKLIASRRAAMAWVEDSRSWLDIGRARFRSAARAGTGTPQGRAELDRAVAAYDRALARSPGDSIAWMRLGEIRLLRSGPSRRAAGALHMSIRTAPFFPKTMIERLRLALLVWRYLDEPGRVAVLHQVRMARRNRWLAPALKKLAGDPEVGSILAPLIEKIAAEPNGAVSVRLAL